MAIVDRIRNGVAKINTKTASLQATVQHVAFLSEDGKGKKAYAAPVPIQALVQPKVKQYHTHSGKLVQTLAILTILEPVTPNGAAGRTEPIDPRDIFILDNGVSSPQIESDSALEDAGLGNMTPFLNIVTLGKVVSSHGSS